LRARRHLDLPPLKERAAATGVPEGELIRAGIDQQLEGTMEKADWRSLAESLSSSWAERDGLDSEMREIRRRWNRRDRIMGRKTGRPTGRP
jgi:hypothetical protein